MDHDAVLAAKRAQTRAKRAKESKQREDNRQRCAITSLERKRQRELTQISEERTRAVGERQRVQRQRFELRNFKILLKETRKGAILYVTKSPGYKREHLAGLDDPERVVGVSRRSRNKLTVV